MEPKSGQRPPSRKPMSGRSGGAPGHSLSPDPSGAPGSQLILDKWKTRKDFLHIRHKQITSLTSSHAAMD